MAKTIRESLTCIKNAGGELSIKLAPLSYGEGAFVIRLDSDEYCKGVLLDEESILDVNMLKNCLDAFCLGIERHLQKAGT